MRARTNLLFVALVALQALAAAAPASEYKCTSASTSLGRDGPWRRLVWGHSGGLVEISYCSVCVIGEKKNEQETTTTTTTTTPKKGLLGGVRSAIGSATNKAGDVVSKATR